MLDHPLSGRVENCSAANRFVGVSVACHYPIDSTVTLITASMTLAPVIGRDGMCHEALDDGAP